MRHGIVFPNTDVRTVPQLAAEAEQSGWDGVFVPDCINIPASSPEIGFDPWVTLAAVAARTSRVVLGTMVTPLSRRRPWKVARETMTLDHLSEGRLVLPVGLGALDDEGFGKVGEATGTRERAELLDESLAIIDGLWSGEPFSFSGRHYTVGETTFLPRPVQQPRIPVWVVGAWRRERSLRRAIHWDGLLPNALTPEGTHREVTPGLLAEIAAWVAEHRAAATPFHVIMEASTPADDAPRAREVAREWADAGATWLLESFWTGPNDVDTLRRRIQAGPPSVE
ncbi:MAG: LLM class flavin-dependent oxidoreductase [Thermomicrobiales bacterium]